MMFVHAANDYSHFVVSADTPTKDDVVAACMVEIVGKKLRIYVGVVDCNGTFEVDSEIKQ